MKNFSIREKSFFSENDLIFYEVIRQEYSGNECIISAGFVNGDNKPEVDTIYLKLVEENVNPTILLLRPDEAQIISWVLNSVVWSHLMKKRKPFGGCWKDEAGRAHRPSYDLLEP